MAAVAAKVTPNGTGRNGPGGHRPSLSSFPSRTTSVRAIPNGLKPNRIRAPSTRSQNTVPESPSVTISSPPRRKSTKLKPQYPLDSDQPHVEYILVASFDIDKGPTMEHQFPAPISGDETMLAELMLPDQTHLRSEDWTIFFLHKDVGEQEEERRAAKERRKLNREERRRARVAEQDTDAEDREEAEESSSEDEDVEDQGGEGPPLIYVLNLVNTKQDATVKR